MHGNRTLFFEPGSARPTILLQLRDLGDLFDIDLCLWRTRMACRKFKNRVTPKRVETCQLGFIRAIGFDPSGRKEADIVR